MLQQVAFHGLLYSVLVLVKTCNSKQSDKVSRLHDFYDLTQKSSCDLK